MKEATVEMVLDTDDKDGGEKKHSGRYVAAPGQVAPVLTNAYVNRTFIGMRPSPAKLIITVRIP